jgi:beta-xylosidase
MRSIRLFFGVFACLFCSAISLFSQQDQRAHSVAVERQPIADKGNGYYRNPIIAGDLADPSLIRVGEDYYMIHGKGLNYAMVILHSQDLVNWKPLARVPTGGSSHPWAPDLVFTHGKFYIYVTIPSYREDGSRRFQNFVYHAERIEGPWSEPIDLGIDGWIDPGHLTDKEGNRFLFMEKEFAVELTRDGLATAGEFRKFYTAWEYPLEWDVGCWCLEAPKLFIRGDYYYLVTAMGGTGMPATAHMAAVSRSESPHGPWEHSPYNPLIHTFSMEEAWWSQGHASLIEHTDGSWWAMYHGIENGHRELGRQTLLLPVDWTSDDWPVVKDGIRADDLIKKPQGENVGHGIPLSDDFTGKGPGFQWIIPTRDLEHARFGGGELVLEARGSSPKDALVVRVKHVNYSFEVSVEVEIEAGSEGGILLGGHGIGLKKGDPPFYPAEQFDPADFPFSPVLYNSGNLVRHRSPELEGYGYHLPVIHLKIINNRNNLSFYMSEDGESWIKTVRSGYSDELTPGLYAVGEGKVIFRNFRYQGIE